MIGLHGKVTGFATLNMAEQVAMQTVEGLLQEKFGKRCPQAVPSSGRWRRRIDEYYRGWDQQSVDRNPLGVQLPDNADNHYRLGIPDRLRQRSRIYVGHL